MSYRISKTRTRIRWKTGEIAIQNPPPLCCWCNARAPFEMKILVIFATKHAHNCSPFSVHSGICSEGMQGNVNARIRSSEDAGHTSISGISPRSTWCTWENDCLATCSTFYEQTLWKRSHKFAAGRLAIFCHGLPLISTVIKKSFSIGLLFKINKGSLFMYHFLRFDLGSAENRLFRKEEYVKGNQG